MGTKRQALAGEERCFSRAALDEPLFILRAEDPLAPKMVRYWAQLYHSSRVWPLTQKSVEGMTPEQRDAHFEELNRCRAKHAEALNQAHRMERYCGAMAEFAALVNGGDMDVVAAQCHAAIAAGTRPQPVEGQVVPL